MPGDIGYSQLQVRENIKTKKKTLAWMTGFYNRKIFLYNYQKIRIN